jgi:hypothetical protein
MGQSSVQLGHRVRVRITLFDDDRARLLGGALAEGSKSVLFRFRNVTEEDTGDMFGAFIEHLDAGKSGALSATLLFWDPVAPIYVLRGQRFDVWYMKIVGEGEVLGVEP